MIKRYLEYIRKQECCVCGRDAVPHHIRSKKYIPNKYAGGMGTKPSHYVCIPLCHVHHQLAHTKPWSLEALINPSCEIIKCLVKYIKEGEK